jgi:hypothetical protein
VADGGLTGVELLPRLGEAAQPGDGLDRKKRFEGRYRFPILHHENLSCYDDRVLSINHAHSTQKSREMR